MFDFFKNLASVSKKQTPVLSPVVARKPQYEVVEKSKTHDKREYHYKALIRIVAQNGQLSIFDLSVIADEIQTDMGYHVMGYHSYDFAFQTVGADLYELTWKSWDSCD